MQFAVSVHRAAEDYLEAMLMMKEQHGYVRSIDVAEHLGVTKPSVTYATKQLKQNGFITMDRDGLITLTESGMEIADRIYTRHKTLTEFFMRIGVDEKTAREDACKVESALVEEAKKYDAEGEGRTAKTAPGFQFMRVGYFCMDSRDCRADHLVFNRSVLLKDSFKPGK